MSEEMHKLQIISKNQDEQGEELLSPPPPIGGFFTKLDYNVKVYFPKKFEVLRKFYCGSHLNFI